MRFFCALGSISVMSLYFFDSVETVWVGIVSTIFASIGFWASLVFYNAYLPEIAHPEQQDRASAKGFIFGYIGSVILLIINLILIQKPDLFGLTPGSASRISFVMVGLWWFGFAQITFKRLPKHSFNKEPAKAYNWKGFKEL